MYETKTKRAKFILKSQEIFSLPGLTEAPQSRAIKKDFDADSSNSKNLYQRAKKKIIIRSINDQNLLTSAEQTMNMTYKLKEKEITGNSTWLSSSDLKHRRVRSIIGVDKFKI